MTPHQAAQKAVEALKAAQRAINSMKVEAETAAAGGDEQMLQDACETISAEGLEADTELRAAIAALSALQQQPEPVAKPSRVGEDGWRKLAESQAALLALQEVPREPDLACVCGAVWERNANDWEMVHSPRAASPSTTQQEAARLSDFVNAARINASDMPLTVVQKLQAAIDAAPSTAREEAGVQKAQDPHGH